MAPVNCTRRPRFAVRLALFGFVLALGALSLGGCTRKAASDWAQTSPVISADSSASIPYRLGVHGG